MSPAKSERQRRFFGAELSRKREGKEIMTHMSEKEMEKMATKPKGGYTERRRATIKKTMGKRYR